MATETFAFRFSDSHRVAAAVFGVTPRNSRVVVTDDEIQVDYGPWHMSTPVSNILEVKPTGPYSFLKSAGPAHLSFRDRGITFASNGERVLCIRFHDPVPGIGPGRKIKHPGMTVTVADLERLEKALID
jgi:hypothetical protein